MRVDNERKEKAKQLKKLRLMTGLTQMGLANISGLKQCTISKLERGLSAWSIDTELIYTKSIAIWQQNVA